MPGSCARALCHFEKIFSAVTAPSPVPVFHLTPVFVIPRTMNWLSFCAMPYAVTSPIVASTTAPLPTTTATTSAAMPFQRPADVDLSEVSSVEDDEEIRRDLDDVDMEGIVDVTKTVKTQNENLVDGKLFCTSIFFPFPPIIAHGSPVLILTWR